MQQAYAQANEVVTMASKQAQEILDNATIEANELKSQAMQYMDDMLAHLENIISASTQQASSNYDTLIGNLNQYRDIIQSNRSELHPVDEDLEGIDNADEASDESSHLRFCHHKTSFLPKAGFLKIKELT